MGAVALAKDAHVIDVGGGASAFVDKLLDRGFTNVTVADLAEAALERTRDRLGERAGRVRWLVADARTLRLAEPVDFWHDRAVFHFLTDPADQQAYVDSLRRALAPGGHAMIATFALDGPEKCSGLSVARYGPDTLLQRLGEGFELIRSERRAHTTPSGASQAFTCGLFRMKG